MGWQAFTQLSLKQSIELSHGLQIIESAWMPIIRSRENTMKLKQLVLRVAFRWFQHDPMAESIPAACLITERVGRVLSGKPWSQHRFRLTWNNLMTLWA